MLPTQQSVQSLSRGEMFIKKNRSTMWYRTMRISVANRMVQRRDSRSTLLRFTSKLFWNLESNQITRFNKLATNRSILFALLRQYLANCILISYLFPLHYENPASTQVNIGLQNYKLQHF